MDLEYQLIRDNLNEMLIDRGYKKLNEEIKEAEEAKLDVEKYKKLDGRDIVVIYVIMEEKLGVEFIKMIIQTFIDLEIDHLIIISRDKLTPFAKKYIISESMKIELFLFEELKFNITKHELVPKHVLLSNKESQEVIEYYGKKYLPQIKKSDIVSRYFDAELGQIFRIYRNEGGIYYRLVVN